MAENKEINLKEIAATSIKKETSESLLSKLGSTNPVHGFSKGVIKINNFKKLDNIGELLMKEENRFLRLPFAGVNFISMKYSLEELENIIKSNPLYNVMVKPVRNIISKIDIKINPELKEVSDEMLTSSEEKEVSIIKGLKINKEGELFVVLDNSALVTSQLVVSNLSSLSDDIQGNIRKEVIPDSLLRLRKDYYLIKQDLKCLDIGRIGNQIVMRIDSKEFFKNIILPKIIIEKESDPAIMNETLAKSNRSKYASHVKVNTTFDIKKNDIYYSIESEGYIPSLEIVINKSNFVCLNSSYTNEFLKSILKDKVNNYVKGLKFEEEKYAKKFENLNLDLDIRMIPLANLSKQLSANKGLPITSMIKVTKYNNPLYVPTLEINKEVFVSESLNPIFNSYTFSGVVNKKPNPNLVNKVFGRLVTGGDPYISEFNTFYNSKRIILIPDPKKLILSLYIEKDDAFRDYAISLNTKETMSSFSIQRVY